MGGGGGGVGGEDAPGRGLPHPGGHELLREERAAAGARGEVFIVVWRERSNVQIK